MLTVATSFIISIVADIVAYYIASGWIEIVKTASPKRSSSPLMSKKSLRDATLKLFAVQYDIIATSFHFA